MQIINCKGQVKYLLTGRSGRVTVHIDPRRDGLVKTGSSMDCQEVYSRMIQKFGNSIISQTPSDIVNTSYKIVLLTAEQLAYQMHVIATLEEELKSS